MSLISVLLVDDDVVVAAAIGAVLERQGFRVTLAETARGALEQLRRERYAAVVTDMLFDGAPDGSRVLAAARELQPSCVVIVMTGYPVLEGAVAAVKSGANDYLPKPVNPILLAAKLHRALREREMDQANLEFAELIEILSGMIANTIERIDPYTAGHGERTRGYCLELADRVGLDGTTRNQLQLAAIAHDYGKIYLADQSFLTKDGPLTRDEYAEVQRHPLLGAEKLGNHARLRAICRFIAEHHEKHDGSGYPRGLAGAEISLPGRVLGIAEVFDSLATRRAYKEPWPLSRIVGFFRSQRGRGFDPELTDEFLLLLDQRGREWTCEQPPEPVAAGCILA